MQIVKLAIVWSLVSIAGCAQEPTSPHAPMPAVSVLASVGARQATLDEEFLSIASEYPGFGGLYTEGDTVVVLASSLKDSNRLANDIAGRFFSRHRGELSQFALLPRTLRLARYDFLELDRLRTRLYAVRLPHGLTYVDIAEDQNRLVLGVADSASVELVKRHLQTLQMSSAAIVIRVVTRLEPNQITLLDRIRPVVGGVQIRFIQAGENKGCTLGWNVYRRNGSIVDSSARYFLTNSHCSGSFGVGVNDGTAYYQVSQVSGDSIGQEISDPPTYTGGNCPNGLQCRYSDALLARYQPSATWVHGASAWSSFAVAPAFPPYNGYLMSPTAATTPGTGFALVGISTGEQSGASLVATCFDTYWGPVPYNIYLKCQYKLNKPGISGDSGGPVFQYDANWIFWRHPRGMRWAGSWNPTNGTGQTVYSPISGIEADLGQLSFISTCSSFCP